MLNGNYQFSVIVILNQYETHVAVNGYYKLLLTQSQISAILIRFVMRYLK